MDTLTDLVLVAIGFVGLIGGADLLVRGGSGIARSFGIKPLVIGLTIVAYGTSMPEFMASFLAMQKSAEGISGIALGNVLGSNIFNIAVVLGCTALLKTMEVEKDVFRTQLPITLGVTLMMIVFMYSGDVITRWEGLILFLGIVVYSAIHLFQSRSNMEPGDFEPKDMWERNRFLAFGGIMAGCFLLFLGGGWVVDGSVSIAERIGMSDRVIGATLVALGTSLPELITSIIGIMRKEASLSIGNAIGSCIFNVLMVIGGTALIKPIPSVCKDYYLEFTFLFITLAALWILAGKRRLLNRKHGIILTTIYVIFLILVLTS